jgi:predicted nucleotidyltransferase
MRFIVKTAIKKISAKNKVGLEKQGVVLAYLFGSMARGDDNPESDADIGVLLSEEVEESEYLSAILKLSAFFSEIFPEREIGITILNSASPLLKQNAVIEGKELFVKDDLDRIMFENRALREYEDTRKLRNIYNSFLRDNINHL